jgi:hypothetical protein
MRVPLGLVEVLAFKFVLQIRYILIKAVYDVRLDYPLLLIDERQVYMARVYLCNHASQSIRFIGALEVLVLHLQRDERPQGGDGATDSVEIEPRLCRKIGAVVRARTPSKLVATPTRKAGRMYFRLLRVPDHAVEGRLKITTVAAVLFEVTAEILLIMVREVT